MRISRPSLVLFSNFETHAAAALAPFSECWASAKSSRCDTLSQPYSSSVDFHRQTSKGPMCAHDGIPFASFASFAFVGGSSVVTFAFFGGASPADEADGADDGATASARSGLCGRCVRTAAVCGSVYGGGTDGAFGVSPLPLPFEPFEPFAPFDFDDRPAGFGESATYLPCLPWFHQASPKLTI